VHRAPGSPFRSAVSRCLPFDRSPHTTRTPSSLPGSLRPQPLAPRGWHHRSKSNYIPIRQFRGARRTAQQQQWPSHMNMMCARANRRLVHSALHAIHNRHILTPDLRTEHSSSESMELCRALCQSGERGRLEFWRLAVIAMLCGGLLAREKCTQCAPAQLESSSPRMGSAGESSARRLSPEASAMTSPSLSSADGSMSGTMLEAAAGHLGALREGGAGQQIDAAHRG